MGTSQSTPSETVNLQERTAQLLKESSPQTWSVSQVVEWVEGQTTLRSSFRDRLLSAIRQGWVDGEMCCDTSYPQLRQCLGLRDDKQFSAFQALIQHQIREHQLVAPFQENSSGESPPAKRRVHMGSDHTPREEICAKANWAQLIADYHEYTINSSTRASPTLKIIWVCQPKISRRYYGAPVEALSPQAPPPYHSLHNLLYYSMAVSAAKCSSDVFSRSLGSKRVNPSSGGLHPIESYVIYQAEEEIVVSHYFPAHHILEQRYALPVAKDSALSQLEADEFVIALSAVQWREIWKYGPRGWRYTQLDVGHALGALLLSASLHDYHLTVFDALAVEYANVVLALNEQELADHREHEQAQVFIHCSPRATPSSFALFPFLQALATGRESVPAQGQPNSLFLRSDEPIQWPYIPVLDQAVKTGVTNEPFLEQKDTENGIDVCRIFADKTLLAPAVRARRSATSFTRGSATMTVEDLNSCLCSLVTYMSIISENSIHVGLWIHGVDGISVGRYFLYRGGDDLIPTHLKASGAQRVDNDQLDDMLELYCLPPQEKKQEEEADTEEKHTEEGVDSVEKQVRKEASDCSCYQGIANDCGVVFSFLAPLERQVAASPNRYRSLHWEAGFLGQLLYVNAYQRKLGATGMGCFLDPESASVFPIPGYQPLYHLALGPTETDSRWTALP